MARDIERAIARLDRLARDERPGALRGLERANFRILLGGAVEGPVPDSGDGREFARRCGPIDVWPGPSGD